MIQQHSLGFKDKIIFKNGKIYSEPNILGVSIKKMRDLIMPKNSALCYLNEAICENSYEIVFDKNKPDGNPRKLLDSSKINSLGWKSKTTLTDGLTKTYNWYLENQEDVRN